MSTATKDAGICCETERSWFGTIDVYGSRCRGWGINSIGKSGLDFWFVIPVIYILLHETTHSSNFSTECHFLSRNWMFGLRVESLRRRPLYWWIPNSLFYSNSYSVTKECHHNFSFPLQDKGYLPMWLRFENVLLESWWTSHMQSQRQSVSNDASGDSLRDST